MAANVRYSQRVSNIAREKSYGMVKIAYDGRFLLSDDDKVAVSVEGPASKAKFELVREFLQKFMEIPNEPKSSSPQPHKERTMEPIESDLLAAIIDFLQNVDRMYEDTDAPLGIEARELLKRIGTE